MGGKRRKFWGWGYEDAGPSTDYCEAAAALLAARLGCNASSPATAPRLEEIDLSPPGLSAPASLQALVSADPYERASHTYGKAYRDIVRCLRKDFSAAPDLVAFPRSEQDLIDIIDWLGSSGSAAIPYGGGSSVCGGVEARREAGRYAVSVDMRGLGRILEVDECSRAAKIEAGIYGPALEDGLRPLGLTLRHFPQSFEFSTLGGWIATRAGGHYATLYTHIDDFVESLRMITPSGVIETRRLPGSGAGPSPDRLLIGSEGCLGIITQAWMRLQRRPVFRNSVSVSFKDFYAATQAVRAIAQAALYPSNLRLLDAEEAMISGAGDGSAATLIVGFESFDHELDAWMDRALQCAADHGGTWAEGAGKTRKDQSAGREGAAGAWRQAFLQAPYLRDALLLRGFITDTFESAITWDRFPDFHREVISAVSSALETICGAGIVTCRFTHVYPDGPAPYFTVLAPAKPNSELEQWDEIKAAASQAVLAAGGTITHHHAVGRDHRPWYDQQRPELFARGLRALKRELDPGMIMNPGVLIDA